RERRGAVGLVAVAQRDRSGYGRGGRVGAEREKGLSKRLWIADCGLRIGPCGCRGRRLTQRIEPSRTNPQSAIPNPQFISCPALGDWRIIDRRRAPPRGAV